MYDTPIIMQFDTRFRRVTPEPCAKFHDDSLSTVEVINKRVFEISERNFFSNPRPWTQSAFCQLIISPMSFAVVNNISMKSVSRQSTFLC